MRGRRPSLSPSGRRLSQEAASARAVTRRTTRYAIDFMYGQSEPDPRVVRHLRRGFGKVLAEPFAFNYGDPAGDEGLPDRGRAAPAWIAWRRAAAGADRDHQRRAAGARHLRAGSCSGPAIARSSRIPATKRHGRTSRRRRGGGTHCRRRRRAWIHQRCPRRRSTRACCTSRRRTSFRPARSSRPRAGIAYGAGRAGTTCTSSRTTTMASCAITATPSRRSQPPSPTTTSSTAAPSRSRCFPR